MTLQLASLGKGYKDFPLHMGTETIFDTTGTTGNRAVHTLALTVTLISTLDQAKGSRAAYWVKRINETLLRYCHWRRAACFRLYYSSFLNFLEVQNSVDSTEIWSNVSISSMWFKNQSVQKQDMLIISLIQCMEIWLGANKEAQVPLEFPLLLCCYAQVH